MIVLNEPAERDTYGGTPDAQKRVGDLILETFSADFENEYSPQDAVLRKFSNWGFPYKEGKYDADKWIAAVAAWCDRNAKLPQLQKEWETNVGAGTDGTLKESWSGEDKNTSSRGQVKRERKFTDNAGKRTETLFNGIGQTTSMDDARVVQETPVDGKNTQDTVDTETQTGADTVTLKRGTMRTYSDGRTPAQRITAVESATSPLYKFINGFALILAEPPEEE